MFSKLTMWTRRNVDTKTVVSAALGSALLGGFTYFAVKSGIKPLKTAASIAHNGKKGA